MRIRLISIYDEYNVDYTIVLHLCKARLRA